MTKQTTKKVAQKAQLKSAVKVKKTMIDPNFSPNKMGFAVAALAAVSLVLLGVVAMYNS